MKHLLTTTAAVESGTGLALVTAPSVVAALILGSSLDTALALAFARIAGVAILALGVACWFARRDEEARSARGIIGAMVLYNVGVLLLLVYAGVASGLSGIALWPMVLVHAVMGVWCVTRLLRRLP